MKTKEELNALKEEVETLNKKLAELTDEELAEVSGGQIVHHSVLVIKPAIEPTLHEPTVPTPPSSISECPAL